jgi:hypothetical protein
MDGETKVITPLTSSRMEFLNLGQHDQHGIDTFNWFFLIY